MLHAANGPNNGRSANVHRWDAVPAHLGEDLDVTRFRVFVYVPAGFPSRIDSENCVATGVVFVEIAAQCPKSSSVSTLGLLKSVVLIGLLDVAEIEIEPVAGTPRSEESC